MIVDPVVRLLLPAVCRRALGRRPDVTQIERYVSDKQAIVVAPELAARDLSTPVRRRLARGVVSRADRSVNLSERVLQCLGVGPSRAGVAACRYVAETGRRPDGWIAAADPLLLEPMLDHVRVRASERNVDADWVERVFAALNDAFAGDYLFESVGTHGYIHGPEVPDLARFPATQIIGEELAQWLPPPVESKVLHRLISEVQMILHTVNEDVNNTGMPNSLWLWGGGEALVDSPALPTLYGDTAELLGLWRLNDAPVVRATDGSETLADALQRAQSTASADTRRSNAVIIASAADVAKACDDPWQFLSGLNRLHMLFGDGVTVALRSSDRFRIWRGKGGLEA